MSAVAAAVVGGGALALGATSAVALGAAGVAGAASMSRSASSQARAAQAAQERAAQGLASSSDYAAELADALGRERLEFERRQYDEMSPLARQVSQAQIGAQEEQMRQARDYYDYMQETFRPVERGLVADAERFSTEGFREQQAREAAAAAGRAFGITQDAAARAAASRGISIGSGAGMAMGQQANLGLAAQRAQAMTGARTQAEQLGWARRLDVTGLGRGLPGASTAAYAGATGAGSAGLTSAMAPGVQFGQGMTAAGGTMLTGTGQQIQGLGGLYSGQTNLAAGALSNLYGMQGAMLGAGGTLGGAWLGR